MLLAYQATTSLRDHTQQGKHKGEGWCGEGLLPRESHHHIFVLHEHEFAESLERAHRLLVQILFYPVSR